MNPRRVFAEGVVIVVSILFAFGIDAWWGGVQDRERERHYLTSLRTEFEAARDGSSSSSGWTRVRATRSALALLGQIQGDPRPPEDSLYMWASGLSQQIEFDPPRAVLDDLISSGETQLIHSDSLRLAIARYPSQLAQLAYADAQAWATWEQRIQPYLEGRIPRVERLRRGSFGRVVDIPFGASPHTGDWESVLSEPGFEDVVAERWMRVEIGIGRYRDTLELIDEIIRLIDVELAPGPGE